MGPKDREERQLMRQRGAGTRQVKNIAFDFVLPGQEIVATEPPQSTKSGRSRKTPQPELLPQRSSKRTPKPDNKLLQSSPRKKAATTIPKKRGRPAKTAPPEDNHDRSSSRIIQTEKKGSTGKRGRPKKAGKEEGDTTVLIGSEVQNKGPRTILAPSDAEPAAGVKKRKKRKSIGQRSTSRAEVANVQSPLKPARGAQKRRGKTDSAAKADLDVASAIEVQKEPLVNEISPVEGETAHPPEIAGTLKSGADSVGPDSEQLQRVTIQISKKRKQEPVEMLPKKRVKASPTRKNRVAKPSKAQKLIKTGKDTSDAAQSLKEAVEYGAGTLDDVHERQEAASGVVEPRANASSKRKRVAVVPQPKKRVKGGVTRIDREQEAQNETATAEAILEPNHSVEESAEVEEASARRPLKKREGAVEEAEPQTQKPKLKRRKRKSIGQQKPKRKPLDLSTRNGAARREVAGTPMAMTDELINTPTSQRGRPRTKQPVTEGTKKSQAESLGHTIEKEGELQPSDARPNNKPKARRGRPKSIPTLENAVDLAGENTAVPEPEEERVEAVESPILPIKKKRGRPKKADATQIASETTTPTRPPASRKPRLKSAPKANVPPKISVPVTIYAPPSPASDAEDDPLTTSHDPHPVTKKTKKNNINPVDVLSQICSELLSQSSAALAEQVRHLDSASSNDASHLIRRTKEITDHYAHELASRLLQLTTNLNANTSLKGRARTAAKEEKELKRGLKLLRKEREEARARNEEREKERKKRELEELLGGIAGAVKKGWDMQEKEMGPADDAVAGMAEEVVRVEET